MKRLILLVFILASAAGWAGTIAEQLTTLSNIKADIKTAIEAKGQTCGDDFSVYDDAISSITIGFATSTSNVYPIGLEEDGTSSATVVAPKSQLTGKYITAVGYLGNGKILSSGIATNRMFYKSSDYGETWSNATTSTQLNHISSEIVYCGNGIAISGGIGTVPNCADAYICANYGASLTRKILSTDATGANSAVYCGSDTVLVDANYCGRVYRSTNTGIDWQLATYSSDVSNQVFSFAYCGNGIVLGSMDFGIVIKSEDRGATWEAIFPKAGESRIYALVYMGNGKLFAYGRTGGNALISNDYGDTWTAVASIAANLDAKKACYRENGEIWLFASGATTGTIYVGKDYGTTWTSQSHPNPLCKGPAYLGNSMLLFGSGDLSVDKAAIYMVYGGQEEEEIWK